MGLHNRSSLLSKLQRRVNASCTIPRNYALLVISVDQIQRLTEIFGHVAITEALEQVADRLRQTVHGVRGSCVASVGQDRFAVLVDNLYSPEDALTYAESLEFLLKKPISCGGQPVCISISIGIAVGPATALRDAPQMLEDAYLAGHRAASQGAGHCALFEMRMREEAVARLQLESDLRAALQGNQFELYYQPTVWLDLGHLKGFEALIRWRHPQRGMISPAVFIPLAEEIQLVSEIGSWVATQAIQQLASWRSAGLVSCATTMAINISGLQLQDQELLTSLLKELRAVSIPPECLALEVTESLFVGDSSCALRLLEEIANAGIGLDLDDFGTGYSSLSYLHRFPFRSLKIDQSFVKRLGEDTKSTQLVAAIIAFARSLELGVTAEGVETREQAEILSRMGCPVAQGYYFCQPLSALETELYLRSERALFRADQAQEHYDFLLCEDVDQVSLGGGIREDRSGAPLFH